MSVPEQPQTETTLIRSWSLNEYELSSWYNFVHGTEFNETVSNISIVNTTNASISVSMRIVDYSYEQLAIVLPSTTLLAYTKYTVNITPLNLTDRQRLQIKSATTGLEFYASGISYIYTDCIGEAPPPDEAPVEAPPPPPPPAGPFFATGGLKTVDGLYTIHRFFANDGEDFTVVTGSSDVEALIVAGGGAGGYIEQGVSYAGGGGGAGGYRELFSHLVSVGLYPIVVGEGGLSTASTVANGTDSSFDGTVAHGGGAGRYGEEYSTSTVGPANDGGSGGGGASGQSSPGVYSNGPPGISTFGDGNSGGTSIATAGAGGGGGGSGGVGGDTGSTLDTPGVGGLGTVNSITGVATTYAKGGDGGGYTNIHRGAFQDALTSQPGSGGGGCCGGWGGSGDPIPAIKGGDGSNGIVVIRYLTP